MKNERELKAAFRSVYRHLVPGGWFIFDMNTPEALKVLWGSSTWGDAQEALAWIWKNEYNGEKLSAECTATFFVRSGRYWKRFDEVHIERAYSNRVLRRLLREVGFDVRGSFRCLTFERPTRDTLRVCVVARRPG
jgi:SAM-dependent methyltransferase